MNNIFDIPGTRSLQEGAEARARGAGCGPSLWRDEAFGTVPSPRDAPIVGRAKVSRRGKRAQSPTSPCRARDGRGLVTVATTEPPSPALRSPHCDRERYNSQGHQLSPQDVSRETFVPIPLFWRYLRHAAARKPVPADRLFGFGRKTAPMPMLPEANSVAAAQVSRDLGICRASFRKPGAPGPKCRSELAWCRFAPIACGRPRTGPDVSRETFVRCVGGSPHAPPERGAASATRCGPGSLSFGRTSDGRTRLRACLAPR